MDAGFFIWAQEKRKMRRLIVVIFGLCLAHAAFAEEKSTQLDKIVVTPSRMEEKLGSASCSISVVDT